MSQFVIGTSRFWNTRLIYFIIQYIFFFEHLNFQAIFSRFKCKYKIFCEVKCNMIELILNFLCKKENNITMHTTDRNKKKFERNSVRRDHSNIMFIKFVSSWSVRKSEIMSSKNDIQLYSQKINYKYAHERLCMQVFRILSYT